MIGYAGNALREAYYGEQAKPLMLLTYETLTSEPDRALAAVYDFIGQPRFQHDFQNIEFDALEFDARLGARGLHYVGRKVEARVRETVLPPDIIKRVEPDSFWCDPAMNTRGVSTIR